MSQYKHEYCFPEAKNIVVSGDIHGEFNQLVFKMCMQYGMTDTLLIVAGDCGFGFEKKVCYDQMVAKNSKRMNKANNWIVFVRGNHDNPAYFDGEAFNHKRFIAVPDYSIIKACDHTILCVGGAVSVDRQWRLGKMQTMCFTDHKEDAGIFKRSLYWPDDAPVYKEELLNEINEHYAVDTVITHTAPSFCEFTQKDGLCCFAVDDENLIADVAAERKVMDDIHEYLVTKTHPVTHWYYGHFHQSWHASINDVLYTMLDIMEFHPIY